MHWNKIPSLSELDPEYYKYSAKQLTLNDFNENGERFLLDKALANEQQKIETLLKSYFYPLQQGWTQTLHPKYYNMIMAWQHHESEHLISKYLISKGIPYLFVPELTQDGNVHYHGYIKLPHDDMKCRIIKNRLRSICGYFKQSVINDKETWWKYVFKEYTKTRTACPSLTLSYWMPIPIYRLIHASYEKGRSYDEVSDILVQYALKNSKQIKL